MVTPAVVTREDMAIGEVTSPSVAVGDSRDIQLELTDLWLNPIKFSLFTITQVDIAAPGLAAADAVRLRLYRSGKRRDPADVVAEFDGTSQVSGMWVAAFSNRRIEYIDANKANTVWIRVRNTAGNTGVTIFQVRLYGRHFPLNAP